MNCLKKRHVCVYLLFCIMHGSVVLGNGKKQCIIHVHREFARIYEPNHHFATAFTDYNRDYFIKQTPPNSNACGYFEDLISRIGEIDHLISSPKDYCKQLFDGDDVSDMVAYFACRDAMFMLLANKNLGIEEEKVRVRNITATAAFKHIYLNHILNDLTFEKVYPQRQYEWYLHDVGQDIVRLYYAQRKKKKDDDNCLQVIEKMRSYFIHLNDAMQQISENVEFRKVEDYCASAADASTSTPSAEDKGKHVVEGI